MYTQEMVIVTEPMLKTGRTNGREFAVARAAIQRQEFRKSVGAHVTVQTYVGLTALDENVAVLMELGVGQRVRVSGELQEQTYTTTDGRPGTDIKCLVDAIVVLDGSAPALPEEVSGAGRQGYP